MSISGPNKRHSGLCPNCGTKSSRLYRDFKGGFNDPVCERCRRVGHENCQCCGKHRRPAKYDDNGKPWCAQCIDHFPGPFVCPSCGMATRFHTVHRCLDCYWKEKSTQFFIELHKEFKSQWLRSELGPLAEYLSSRKDWHATVKRMRMYRPILLQLDERFPHRGEISYDTLAHLLHSQHVSTYKVLVSFFAHRGILPQLESEQWRRFVADQATYRLLNRLKGAWYQSLVSDYYQYSVRRERNYERRGWSGERSKIKARTTLSRVSAAAAFLHSLEMRNPDDIRSIRQEDVDKFLYQKPGYRYAISHFIAYLNKVVKYFTPLNAGNRRDAFDPKHIGHERVRDLIRRWLATRGDECRTALICTLIFFYSQTAKNVLAIKLSDIQELPDGRYQIAVNGVELNIFGGIASLFRRYLANRQIVSPIDDIRTNPFLFPGKMPSFHLSSSGLRPHLLKYEVTAYELYSTGLQNHFLNGVDHPNIVAKGFGVSKPTALHYYMTTEPELRDDIAEALRK